MDSVHPSAPDDTYESWVGRVIDGRYRIDGLLGEGGMGAVFEAEHLKLLKPVALKVIHPEFAGDGDVAKRFVREAMASAQLEHPHVCSATDYGTLEEGGAYLVMPLVRGGSLRDALDDDGALGWLRACEVGQQITDALSSAHKAGIVHRDLKPDNVMLEPRDDGAHRVLVLDFGIARVADEKLAATGQALTRVGTVIGTPGYMAPEQALGESVDFRVDLYAVGLLLHEMVTGEKLFDIEDLTAIVTRQLTEPTPRLSELGHEIPEELDELVARLLERKREDRPQSATEVRELLGKLVLSAQLQRVTSGEHSLPDVGNVTGPFRHPKPERGEKAAPTPTMPAANKAAPKPAPAAVAPTMMADAARPKTTTPTGVAQVDQLIERARELPKPLLFGGAAGVAFMALAMFVSLVALISGGDEDALAKREMVAAQITPVEETPEDEEEEEEDPPPSTASRIPVALQQQFSDMLNEERQRRRRRAAREILAYEPVEDVPEFVIAIANIESTSRCTARREHVVRLGEIGDLRALPVLERLDAQPRNRCGNLFRRVDCLGCLRDELDVALERLRP